MIDVRLIDPMEYFDQAMHLIESNWHETGLDFPFIKQDVRMLYEVIAHTNSLFGIGAFDDAEMIGYCGVSLMPHPFNRSIKFCNLEGFFLQHEYRYGKIGGKMILLAEAVAHMHKAQYMQWHARHGTPFATALSGRYERTNDYFIKRFDHG